MTGFTGSYIFPSGTHSVLYNDVVNRIHKWVSEKHLGQEGISEASSTVFLYDGLRIAIDVRLSTQIPR